VAGDTPSCPSPRRCVLSSDEQVRESARDDDPPRPQPPGPTRRQGPWRRSPWWRCRPRIRPGRPSTLFFGLMPRQPVPPQQRRCSTAPIARHDDPTQNSRAPRPSGVDRDEGADAGRARRTNPRPQPVEHRRPWHDPRLPGRQRDQNGRPGHSSAAPGNRPEADGARRRARPPPAAADAELIRRAARIRRTPRQHREGDAQQVDRRKEPHRGRGDRTRTSALRMRTMRGSPRPSAHEAPRAAREAGCRLRGPA